MKKLLTILLAISVSSLGIAADAPTKKKSAPKAEAKADGPSNKAKTLSKSLTASQRSKLLTILNEGDDKALMALPGIGETRAASLKKSRPFIEPVDLVKVDGIGDDTFAEIVAYAKAGFPGEKKAEEGKAKPEPKKKAPAKAKTTKKKAETEEKDSEETKKK
jgi:DNA uptake protein ComE-like DNA-binding protein